MSKKLFLSICILSATLTSFSQTNSSYDKKLADSLKGDDYGMKNYVLAILKTGPKTFEKPKLDSLFRGHMDNIVKLASEGKLVVAGPLGQNDRNYRGIFILNVDNFDAAKALLQGDPSIVQGLFDVEYFKWYGSAALPTYLPNHDKIQKTKF